MLVFSKQLSLNRFLLALISIFFLQGCDLLLEFSEVDGRATPYSHDLEEKAKQASDMVTERQIQEYITTGKFSSSLSDAGINLQCFFAYSEVYYDGKILINTFGLIPHAKCLKEIVGSRKDYLNIVFVGSDRLIHFKCDAKPSYGSKRTEKYKRVIDSIPQCGILDESGRYDPAIPKYVKEFPIRR